jgi:hypothetical protein
MMGPWETRHAHLQHHCTQQINWESSCNVCYNASIKLEALCLQLEPASGAGCIDLGKQMQLECSSSLAWYDSATVGHRHNSRRSCIHHLLRRSPPPAPAQQQQRRRLQDGKHGEGGRLPDAPLMLEVHPRALRCFAEN